MSIFNWGIYAGIGLAFPIGRYITELNLWNQVRPLYSLRLFPNSSAIVVAGLELKFKLVF